jgi:hypothetical protein
MPTYVKQQTFHCDTNRTFSAEAWVTDTFIVFMNAAPNTPCIAATVLRGRTFICSSQKKISVMNTIQFNSVAAINWKN